MRRARGTARPTGQRPDVDPQPPRPPTGPAAARGPRRRRPVTAGGAPPRAGRPPAPEGPADARRPPPRRPPPETRGRARPRPSNPHTPGAAGPAGPRPLAPAHPLGGPLPEPAFPGTLPPPTHHHRGRREGAPTGSWAPSGQGTRVRGTGEARTGRENRTDGRGRRGGWGTGREKAPRLGRRGEARRLATGAAGPERQTDGRPATGRGRPAQGRRREAAGQGKRPRDGEPPPATPHSPPDATGGSAPRGSAAFVGGGSRGRRHGRKARGVGWGRGELAEPTPSPPHPRTLGANLEGRGGEGRAIGKRGRTPEGDATGRRGRVAGRPRPGGGGNGGAEGPAAGGGARAGKQAEENPPLPTRYPHNSATPPPHLSRAAPRPPDTPGSSPRPAPDRPWGAGRPPDASRSPPLPSSRSHPAPHGRRRGSRAGRGAGRGPRAALGTDRVNDPSAGSPTETLLRLLLPLDSQVRPSSQRSARAVGRPRRGRSEGLTKPSNR